MKKGHRAQGLCLSGGLGLASVWQGPAGQQDPGLAGDPPEGSTVQRVPSGRPEGGQLWVGWAGLGWGTMKGACRNLVTSLPGKAGASGSASGDRAASAKLEGAQSWRRGRPGFGPWVGGSGSSQQRPLRGREPAGPPGEVGAGGGGLGRSRASVAGPTGGAAHGGHTTVRRACSRPRRGPKGSLGDKALDPGEGRGSSVEAQRPQPGIPSPTRPTAPLSSRRTVSGLQAGQAEHVPSPTAPRDIGAQKQGAQSYLLRVDEVPGREPRSSSLPRWGS